jgi:DNA mismatch endonuclease (patch repair protein)
VTDVVDAATRSRMMSGIRGKNTKPEIRVRSLLHRAGYRFRLHVSHLPGRPDIVLPRHRAVVFVHGCFWHGHACPLFKIPGTRSSFWRTKIERNRANDADALSRLVEDNWRIATVWECALKGRKRLSDEAIATRLTRWLRGKRGQLEISNSGTRDS